MWGYQRLGIRPDIVTVGKPMGNGHPVAAVITRAELAEQFSPDGGVLLDVRRQSGGQAAALAVLEVMDDERLIDSSRDVGLYLGERLRGLAERAAVLGDVRQIGLAIGVDTADRETARNIVEAMRQSGVLIGTTGRNGNVLKIRPPLVFKREHAEQLVETLDYVLSA